ncbi:zinc knuckle CX2CX4HX4C containing protein [Tanacetum coccineum]
MSIPSEKGTTFGDVPAGLVCQLRIVPKMSTSSPLVSPSTIINVPRELYSIDVAATFGVSYADDSINLNVDESTIPSDPIVQSVDINKSTSYAGVAGGSAKDQPNVNSNFRTLVADPVFDGVNISIPRKVVEKKKKKRNNWAKHGLKRIMMNSKGFFFFKFDSRAGLEAVLEGGPWLIRKSLIILKKWSMDTRLLKEELTRIPIWVKLHDVPIQVFEEDGISLIATFIGKFKFKGLISWMFVTLYSIIFLRMITKETIRVEYELEATPDVDTLRIFGHVHDYCPKKVVSPPIVATSNVVTPNLRRLMMVSKRWVKPKKRKGNPSLLMGGQILTWINWSIS